MAEPAPKREHANLSTDEWDRRMAEPFIGNLATDPVRQGKPIFQCSACGHLAQVWDVQEELPPTVRCLVCGIVRRRDEVRRHAALGGCGHDVRAGAEERIDEMAAGSGAEVGSKEFRALFDGTPVFVWFRRRG